jgi:hypothetical protein
MGILGMMVAGGAQGLANASNQNVAAQQQLEMEGIRGDREDRRETLRQKYLERNFDLQRQDRKETARAQMQLDERNYQRDRADKMTDADAAHRQRLELESMQESGRNSRHARSLSAANERALARSGGSGGGSGGGARSTQGKLIQDLMDLKLAADPDEAYNLVNRSEFLRAALQNPMARLSADKLVDEVDKLTRGLSKQRGGLLNSDQGLEESSFELNPKTGKLVPNGR